MKVKRGKVHNLVRIYIEMQDNKAVDMLMKDYVPKRFDVFALFEEKLVKKRVLIPRVTCSS